jgi:SAM-dependent methyltransferase
MLTQSGDYRLPTASQCAVGNVLIELVALAPKRMQKHIIGQHGFYQPVNDTLCDGQQGLSGKKWGVMEEACGDMHGKSSLDIGCAEGFFCRQAALAGAARVVGIDGRLGTLLAARFIALGERLPITYRLGVFPTIGCAREYDIIFCLSVLHHTLSTKDIWKVLSESAYENDLETLRTHLRALREMTRPGGRCIVEMPYEYDDPAERMSVDFERFTFELMSSGFATARQLGPWEHGDEHRHKKDRILYVAEVR